MDLKEINNLGDGIHYHWYYQSKAKAIEKILTSIEKNTILDVGAGSGFFSKYLLKNTKAKNAWCVDISYEMEHDSIIGTKKIHFRKLIGNLEADLVLFMDVLEHVEDDIELLNSYVDKVPRGTNFLISVPAFQWMWSEHDVFLEHKRRYTLNQIEEVARRSGLKIIKGGYYFGAVMPIAIASRLIFHNLNSNKEIKSQLSKHNPLINKLLAAICYIELFLIKYNRIGGLTAFCLATKE
jgi:2-polyprenyl-3-methyl-5-hydroxy-6-metoxy-1,4-benzoquinol methylase